jgi:hypothetical protein
MSTDLRDIRPWTCVLVGTLFVLSVMTMSETLGRWVFGIGAVMTELFTIWRLAYGLRRLAIRYWTEVP